ncbi:glycoside hydrolase family 32 protein [Mucilaginibacter terrigena]|uniref:Glycoside hydrolase family 32 protein n=1 Tax=Mucilaginibacter terrigena TaxID=2492395 RepID=A0A4Q5LKM8_9SPHI|nr:glycoside hydrolase family 32 protein [Mucilaginibacter terrigena]RYU90148.1 glycoside hydrolase family 32 protein [Mucilaginibacter terrigena]
MVKKGLLLGCFILAAVSLSAQRTATIPYNEPYRPQAHFSPKEKWMNDPNGMVYYKGTYHLFFQHYPAATVWGPMHWGHAVSKDLVHWKQLPIALYPDKLGYIFSGSVVVDERNTSGFGTKDKPAMIAIFTHHDPKGEKAGSAKFQNQSIAYSLDEGLTWTKYKGNPVLKNPGIKDFRDPKVFWYSPGSKWIMSLATKDRITFYSSPDLKTWKKESEFGQVLGAHGGVWECPDLFPLKINGKEYWVLLVSINPGGPNKGSATQYFVGHFDGGKFTPIGSQTKWIDFGPDNYAGVTFGNTGNRKVFMGWMSNWLYANQVPTLKWRNAMTIPRELSLKLTAGDIWLTSYPVEELEKIVAKTIKVDAGLLAKDNNVFSVIKQTPAQYLLKFNTLAIKDYAVILSNTAGERLIVGFDAKNSRYYIDRTKAGLSTFSKQFAGKSYAPRLSLSPTSNFELLVDASSVELFADGGLSSMTGVYFPKKPYTRLSIVNNGMEIEKLQIQPLKSIW